MSIDSQILVSSIVGNSQTFSGAKPRILVYPTTLSLNGSEQRVEEFNSIITNAANFSTNPFLYVHGEASDSSIQDLPHTQAGNFATTFSGDVIVQGTLWASALRKSDGSKINLENLGYSVSNPENTFVLTTSPNSAPSADLLLDTAIKANNDLIVLNQNSILNLATSNQLSDLTNLVSSNTISISSLESLDESLITSTGLAISFALALTITFSCLSIFSFLNCCFSFKRDKKLDSLSPRDDPEESNNSCNLFIKATQDTSRERVKPNKRDAVNKSKLPVKLSGIINIEEILDPIKPPPSWGRKLTPGSIIKASKVEPETITKAQPSILSPKSPV